MKIKEYNNPVKCPNCKIGMDYNRQKQDYEYENYYELMKENAPTIDIFRCPKCKKEFEVSQ